MAKYTQEELDSRLKMQGYSHPEETNSYNSRDNPYMAYNESGSDSYFSHSSTTYAVNYSDSPFCPVCSSRKVNRCSCPKGDMSCNNNHVWTVDKNGKAVLGDPHEDSDYEA